MGRIVFLFITALLTLAGCRSSKSTEYVPVPLPQHHERTESSSDSVHTSDSVSESKTSILQEVDSGYLANLGIISPPKKAWLLQDRQIRLERKSLTHVSHDTIIELDTIPQPYPVTEYKYINELFWWQKLLMFSGIRSEEHTSELQSRE